jgi:hypothetical protein
MPAQSELIKRIKRLPTGVRLLTLGILVLLLGASAWGVAALIQHASTRANKGTQIEVTAIPRSQSTPGLKVTNPVSPYVFGTNLALFDARDQILNSASARALLQQIHPTMIRMPARDSLPISVEIQTAQTIKALGAVPLLVLHGPQDSNGLAENLQIIHAMNSIFGNQTVYYEYGNEADLQGISATNYTSAWNINVPQLKQIAPHAQFVGPVNYRYDHNYLASFLQNAHPLPDEISWHEYTCDDADSNTTCIANINNWTTHITDARAVMTQVLGAPLPIMITEWNYAPNAVQNDGKNNNDNFMQTWTTQALQTLAANRVFASMQYSCTNTAISLINDANQLTMQGATFQNQYERIIQHNQQPPPVAGAAFPTPIPSATANVSVSGPIVFSFEDGGTDGWNASGQGITNVQNSPSVALDGSHSLQVSLSNSDSNDFPYVSVNVNSQPSPPQAGQTVSAYIYLPSNSVTITAKLFVVDNNYHWFSNDVVPLVPGIWNHLTYTISSNMPGQARLIGVQFNSRNSTYVPTSVFIDAVGWS